MSLWNFTEAWCHSLLKIFRTMCEIVDPHYEATRKWYGDLEAALAASSWVIRVCPQKGFRYLVLLAFLYFLVHEMSGLSETCFSILDHIYLNIGTASIIIILNSILLFICKLLRVFFTVTWNISRPWTKALYWFGPHFSVVLYMWQLSPNIIEFTTTWVPTDSWSHSTKAQFNIETPKYKSQC